MPIRPSVRTLNRKQDEVSRLRAYRSRIDILASLANTEQGRAVIEHLKEIIRASDARINALIARAEQGVSGNEFTLLQRYYGNKETAQALIDEVVTADDHRAEADAAIAKINDDIAALRESEREGTLAT